jgi:hypothetical protein
VVVGCMAALVIGAGPAQRRSLAPSGAAGPVTVGAIAATLPAGFHYRYFRSCSYRVTGVRGACVRGVVVADYRLLAQPEIGARGARYPQSGVALELYRAPKQEPPVVATAAHFPVSLSEFHFVGRGLGGPSQSQRELFFRVGGRNYWAIAWTGSKSSPSQRRRLAALISSIRPT